MDDDELHELGRQMAALKQKLAGPGKTKTARAGSKTGRPART